MVLQAGVARLGPPSRHATNVPPSCIARARTTKPQCIKQFNYSRQCKQSRQHKHEHRTRHTRTDTDMRGHPLFNRGSHESGASRPTGPSNSFPLPPRKQCRHITRHHTCMRAWHARALRNTTFPPTPALAQKSARPLLDEQLVLVEPVESAPRELRHTREGVSQGAGASRVAGVCSHAGSNGAVGSSVRGREGAAWAGQRAHGQRHGPSGTVTPGR